MPSERNTLEAPREPGWATSTSTTTLAGEDHGQEKNNITDLSSNDGKTETDNEGSSDELSEDEYPSGTKLIFIVVALVLAIFLLALDMVSFSHIAGCLMQISELTDTRPSLPPPSPKSPKSFRVSTRSAGMAPPSS